jgi:hypothetical protein
MDIDKEIKFQLTRPDVNIYDELVSYIESYFNRHANTMQELKDRESKKQKGDVWELFCYKWLVATQKYAQVWKWNQIPQEHKDKLKLERKEDNGIDIVVMTNTGYQCVQCKYRKKNKITWTSIATFVAMAAMTGPWEKHIVMTNAPGVTRKLKRTEKDISFCRGTFRRTKRDIWLRMVGLTEVHITGGSVTKKKKPTPEELRELRIKHFVSIK